MEDIAEKVCKEFGKYGQGINKFTRQREITRIVDHRKVILPAYTTDYEVVIDEHLGDRLKYYVTSFFPGLTL